jgi:hypothetical protein
MKLDEALSIWKGSGYMKINAYLVKEKTGKLPPHYFSTLRSYNTDDFDIPEVIQTLRENMHPIPTSTVYYRGDTSKKKKDCHVETFMSVSKNEEDAEAFTDAGSHLYHIHLMAGVKGIATGAEGEILLEDGCYWNYFTEDGEHHANIYPPSANKRYPFCTLPAKGGRRKTKRNKANRRKKTLKRK